MFFDSVPSQPDAGAVSMDNEAGIRLLVDHLVSVHGHERIAYLGPPESLGTGASAGHRPRAARGVPRRDRPRRPAAAARVRAHERAGALRGERPRGRRRELMALARPPTAIVGGTDELAIGAAARAARRAGCACPDDVALVSFDEPVSADLLDPPLTSLDRHDAQLGRLAAEALLRTLRGEAAAMGIAPRPRRAERPAVVWVRATNVTSTTYRGSR